jgi:hypothetical protein
MSTPGLNEPGLGGTSTLLEAPDLLPQESTEAGDHEKFSHYAPKDKVMEAMVMGTPVTALCGKVWVPSRDPQRFPVCPTCKEIWESIPSGEDAGS